ncbi:glutamate-cysteine ligase family protein [Haloarcula nitratireducens]|uniref:Glutamate--cysteine ligase n=1 Tax=Haloarcula nitratireducens TaxID=2487749 RepID=A0AAW4PHC4_9EURY|nr:glutamate-cysteine ligase family protein [Halomicroarcula nitratireducens]MBX0297142.1 glutamate--cysteine ligase [Halomicroarcula nitratireducens]
MKLGIEMEFWTVDEQGRLTDGRALPKAHDRIEPEFIAPLVEVRTSPHETEDSLRRELQSILRTALTAARSEGLHLVPLGTPLTSAAPDAMGDRGRLFEDIYGEQITSAKNCAGTHVHFEKTEPVRQLNLLTALDPALALVNSSPYYLGERRQQSSRARAYRQQESDEFARYCGLWSYADSVSEWNDRVETAFELFKGVAASNGVGAAAVEEHFCPEDTMLNPVRLREATPTVEWRAPDTALPSETVRLAFDMGRVVEQAATKSVGVGGDGTDSNHVEIPSFGDLRDLSDAAISQGLESSAVREYLSEMGFDPSAYDPLADRLVGPDVLSTAGARRMRLLAAKLLREDVATLVDDDDSVAAKPAV